MTGQTLWLPAPRWPALRKKSPRSRVAEGLRRPAPGKGSLLNKGHILYRFQLELQDYTGFVLGLSRDGTYTITVLSTPYRGDQKVLYSLYGVIHGL